eukprot:183150-Prorocentrum_minimum.AAC.4
MAPLRSPWTLPTPTLTPIGRLHATARQAKDSFVRLRFYRICIPPKQVVTWHRRAPVVFAGGFLKLTLSYVSANFQFAIGDDLVFTNKEPREAKSIWAAEISTTRKSVRVAKKVA